MDKSPMHLLQATRRKHKPPILELSYYIKLHHSMHTIPIFQLWNFHQLNRKLNKENFIFGIKNESYTTIDNLVLMMIKKFIWNKRCKEEIPTINQFKSYLKKELTHYMNVNLTPKPDVRLKIMDSQPFQDFINQM